MPGAEVSDAGLRLARARERTEAFIGAVAERWEHAHSVRHEMDDDQVRVYVSVSELPPRTWGLDVGDILLDLRSALDYAVYDLARRSTGQDPPPRVRQLKFPIQLHEADFERERTRALVDLPAEAVECIENAQPFRLGGDTSALYVLHELTNVGKHRAIPVVWEINTATGLQIEREGLELQDFVLHGLPDGLVDGALLMTFRLVASQQVASLSLSIRLQPGLVFAPESAAFGSPVIETLNSIGGWVIDLVSTLEGIG